jgi:hypothetical protein
MEKNLLCCIDQLIRMMSEIQTNLRPDLYNLIHHGLTTAARRVMCSIGNFKRTFDSHTKQQIM